MSEELSIDSWVAFVGFPSSIIILVDVHSFPRLLHDSPPFLEGHSDPQGGSGGDTCSLIRGEPIIEL